MPLPGAASPPPVLPRRFHVRGWAAWRLWKEWERRDITCLRFAVSYREGCPCSDDNFRLTSAFVRAGKGHPLPIDWKQYLPHMKQRVDYEGDYVDHFLEESEEEEDRSLPPLDAKCPTPASTQTDKSYISVSMQK